MTRIQPISAAEISQRTRQLRRRRWWRGTGQVWRSLLVSALVAALIWLLRHPQWLISRPEQVIIRGNQFFSDTAIRALLPIQYPQSLLRLKPEEIAAHLETKGPISRAIVTRSLLPPNLSVQVWERKPVAIAIPSGSKANRPTDWQEDEGLIDENGNWMPRSSYATMGLPAPSIKVIGLDNNSRTHWPEFYREISRMAVQVSIIDWQNQYNIILTTPQGKVHLGNYNKYQLTQQLQVLKGLQQLSAEKLKPEQIAYIDLRNSQNPLIVNHSVSP